MMKKILFAFSALAFFSCGGGESTETAETSEEAVEVEMEEESAEEVIAEEPTYDCSIDEISVYLNDPDESGTNVRNAPNGEVVGQLVKDSEDNMEFFIIILESKDGWFHINNRVENMADGIKMNEGGECWIHGSVLGVDTRNYGNQVIPMHASPDHESEQVGEINKEMYGLHPLEKCGRWVKLKVNGTEGWVHDEWICGNPLTTCS